jgi:Protein of unknown function DUF262
MQINITKTVYKVSDFVSWQRTSSLSLSPSFQRRSVWPTAAKSFLIDTVVRGLPMPIIILREQTNLETLEPLREVVDGQQRLRTVISFLEPDLLKDFDEKRDSFVVTRTHNRDIAGKTFRQLSADIRKRILAYEFSVHVLPSDTEDRQVLQIFARMNATGMKLNDQELRNAEYYGALKTLAYDLAYEQLSRWRTWGIFSEMEIARMTEVEETSDLILLMLEGIHGKNQPALNRLYKEGEEDFSQGPEVTRRFRLVMDKIDETFGRHIRSSVFSRKTLFNTLFTYYYDLLFGIKSPLTRISAHDLPDDITLVVQEKSDQIMHGLFDEELSKVLRGATSHASSRNIRLEFMKVPADRAVTA